jgi:hypothetical protein
MLSKLKSQTEEYRSNIFKSEQNKSSGSKASSQLKKALQELLRSWRKNSIASPRPHIRKLFTGLCTVNRLAEQKHCTAKMIETVLWIQNR